MNSLWIIGCGYLGEAIADVFEKNAWGVLKVSRTASAGMEAADVSDKESLSGLKTKYGTPDVLVHCASSGRGGAEAYEKVFFEGAKNLVELFSDSKIILTSSSSVYPQVNGEFVTEESEANPDRETGKILRRAEEEILKGDGVVMRLSGIYGEGRSVILKKWLKGELKVEEDGRRILNQIHRRDAADAFFKVALSDSSGEIYNVSESKPKSQLETIKWLAGHYNKPIPESVPRDLNRKRGWTHKHVSNDKLQGLGWTPSFSSFTDAVVSLEPTITLT